MMVWNAIVLEQLAAGSSDPRERLPSGLRDRRALFADLDHVFSPDGPNTLLAIFALDGLHEYRDFYGPPAARALVVELAARFASTLGQAGTCYQPREDEFVALIDASIPGATLLPGRCLDALHQPDPQVTVSATFGDVLLPDDADDPPAAVRLADQHLSANSPRRKARRDEVTTPDHPRA